MSDSESRKTMQVFTLRAMVPAERERDGLPVQFPFEAQVSARSESEARAEITKLFGRVPFQLVPTEEPVTLDQLPTHLASKMREHRVVRLRAIQPVSSLEEGVERVTHVLTPEARV